MSHRFLLRLKRLAAAQDITPDRPTIGGYLDAFIANAEAAVIPDRTQSTNAKLDALLAHYEAVLPSGRPVNAWTKLGLLEAALAG
jgi:hypothetical protein